MKKQLTASLFSIFSLLLILSACQKEKDDTPVKTKTQLITTGSWKFSSATVGGSDVAAFLQACQKDNIMVFVAAGFTGNIDEGPTKCNSGDPQTNPFTWSFNTAETILNISATLFTGGSSIFTLVSLSESQLVVSQNITIGSTPQNAIVTFVH